MTSLGLILRRLRQPFCKPEREPPRLVMEFRRWPEGKGVNKRMTVQNTDSGHVYELKAMAVMLFALSGGLIEKCRENGDEKGNMMKAAMDAYELASLIVWQARGRP